MKILLIEDSSDDALFIRKHLERAGTLAGHRLQHEQHLDQGLHALRSEPWDVVLLDLHLTESHGLDTLRIVRSVDDDVPVVVLTGFEDEATALAAVEHGAHDYLQKGQLSGPLLVRSLRYAQERHRLLSELRRRATHDSLTGIANREFFEKKVEEAVQRSSEGERSLFLMMLDLDGFKQVNDLAGHDVGDQLLIQVAARLRSCLRDGDVLARLGGDEFGILLPDSSSREIATRVADRIHQSISEPFRIDGNQYVVATSIGIVSPTRHSDAPTQSQRRELICSADMAMYAAKSHSSGQTRFFDNELRNTLVEQADLEERLRDALSAGELRLEFQPIIRLEDDTISGFEALCRWHPSGRGPVLPSVFIPMAERMRLIQPIGRWVIRQACENFADWKLHQSFTDAGNQTVHVNVSPLQLSDRQLLPTIKSSLEEFGLAPHELTVEITENKIDVNELFAGKVLSEIRELGVGLSIDDFGTGFSSLEQLRMFPFNGLKIDRNFVAQLDDPSGEPGVFVEAITTFASLLNLKTVAEGVETAAQAERIRDSGCEYAQGYYFGRPAPMSEIIRSHSRSPALSADTEVLHLCSLNKRLEVDCASF